MVGNFFIVMAGGAVGAALRYGVSVAGPSICGDQFPWATLFVNGMGCLIIGVFLAFGVQQNLETTHLFFVVGVLGALTTFSTFSAESLQLLIDDRQMAAAFNVVGNLFISLTSCSIGYLLGRYLSG